METEYACQPTLGNTCAITFLSAHRLTFPAVMAERAALVEAWRSTDNEVLKQRIGQRLVALNSALVLRFGAVLLRPKAAQ